MWKYTAAARQTLYVLLALSIVLHDHPYRTQQTEGGVPRAASSAQELIMASQSLLFVLSILWAYCEEHILYLSPPDKCARRLMETHRNDGWHGPRWQTRPWVWRHAEAADYLRSWKCTLKGLGFCLCLCHFRSIWLSQCLHLFTW